MNPTRTILLVVTIAFLAPTFLRAQNVFEQWGLFPFGHPAPSDIVPDLHGPTEFDIGQVNFSYDYKSLPESGIRELAEVETVADAVARAKPDASVAALITQQFGSRHNFRLANAALKNYGDTGLVWHIKWHLTVAGCGSSGPLPQYTALLIPNGKVVSPKRTLCDTYSLSLHRWWCSSIGLDQLGMIDDSAPPLDKKEIAERAQRKLEQHIADFERKQAEEPSQKEPGDVGLKFFNQKVVEIPCEVDGDGRVVSHSLWAVNYVNPQRKDDKSKGRDVFTIWVSVDGRVADLKILDSWFNFGDPGSPAPAADPKSDEKPSTANP